MSDSLSVRTATTFERDPRVAARAIAQGIAQADIRLILLFCDPTLDLDALGPALSEELPDVPTVGCTTAGEITERGYVDGSLSALSISSPNFHAVTRRLDDLAQFELGRGDAAAGEAIRALAASGDVPTRANSFGLLLSDGLSMKEEALVSAVSRQLGDIRLFGGSAGDGTNFERTSVYHDGRFRQNCGVLTLVRTSHPFVVFKTQHFEAGSEKMVVTRADPARRVVLEINGAPAAEEYARVIGLDPNQLTPMVFAEFPVVVRVGGALYVRSIQRMADDGSLTFFCAIDEGIVLTVARGVDLVDNLRDTFAEVRAKLGEPELVLGCDCVLRKLEVVRKGLRSEVGRILADARTFGFATYGEQFNAMHVNQTFTGVAIGRARGAD